MAARGKSTSPNRGDSLTQRFHVGQRCALVLDAASGWEPYDGEQCIVIAPKRRMSLWCSDWDGANQNFKRNQARYEIQCFAAGGPVCVRECQLRPLNDGELPSTWDAFEKATGLALWREGCS